jgi:hypothetical protein
MNKKQLNHPVKWYVYRINCDCAGGLHARQRKGNGMTMRCPFGCNKILGIMQFDLVATIKAVDGLEAQRIYRNSKGTKP